MAVAPWLIAALALLGSGSVPGVTGQGIPFLPAIFDPFEPTGLDIFATGGGGGFRGTGRTATRGRHPLTHEHIHRRRRRRALTNSDRADIAFIAATVSKSAAGTFAAQLAARTR